MTRSERLRPSSRAGFTLVEMIVVVFLLAIAMLGILAVFDASARLNKSEQEVADAQGAVRYGIYQMTRTIRMAGAGGLFVTQAVLNRPDPALPGITVAAGGGYDNVTGATVTNLSGQVLTVRPGTDMIEVRGVIFSPLLGFDLSSGCAPCQTGRDCSPCVGSTDVMVDTITALPDIGEHVNNDASNRPQFAAIDAYTLGVSATNPMLVLVSAAADEIHGGCSALNGPQLFPQATYNVGAITAPTNLVGGNTLGPVDFTAARGLEFNNENPADAGIAAQPFNNVRRAGILDDVVYFVSNGVANADELHPTLMQGIRRGDRFDVVPLAEDVEDMQIAYGVDVNNDDAVTRTVPTTATDTDLNSSSQVNGDEWVPNAPGENTPYTPIQFQSDPAPGTFPHGTAAAPAHCPLLRAVMIALVAKSRDSDPTYRAPAAFGVRVMNVSGSGTPFIPATAVYSTGPTTEPHHRRRVQTLRINLRNYSTFE